MDDLTRIFIKHGLPKILHPVLDFMKFWEGQTQPVEIELFEKGRPVLQASVILPHAPIPFLSSSLKILDHEIRQKNHPVLWDQASFPETGVCLFRQDMNRAAGFLDALDQEIALMDYKGNTKPNKEPEELPHVYLRLSDEFMLAADQADAEKRQAAFDCMMNRLQAALVLREYSIDYHAYLDIYPEQGDQGDLDL